MEKFEKFLQITGYDIKNFFMSFIDFNNNHYPAIVAYYQGGKMEGASFRALSKLTKESNIIEPLFVLHKETLDDISMWDILDDFSEIQTKLLTIKNSDRWLRSSFLGRTNSIQIDKNLKTGENFENVSIEKGDIDPEDDWLTIVTPQYIEEESYTSEGSKTTFFVNMQNAGTNEVLTVVDSLSGMKILGKDIAPNFKLNKEGDLSIVEGNDAMVQALDLISSALKGCVPEFPDYGIANEFIGTTVNAIQYPSIFKSLMNMFQRDSRWESVELLDMKIKEDSVFLTIRAKSVMNQEYLKSITI